MRILSLLALAIATQLPGPSVMAAEAGEFCASALKQARLSRLAAANDGLLPRSEREGSRYFRGCRYDVGWMRATRELLCGSGPTEKAALELPRAIMFFFDGAAQFNAARGFALGAVNLDGSEGKDIVGGGDGIEALERFSADEAHAFARERSGIQLHYHPSSGFVQRENYLSAVACVREMQDYLEALRAQRLLTHEPRWVFSGYSNGGYLALELQRELGPRLGAVDLVLTVDPIRQVNGYIQGSFSPTIGERAASTRRLVNVYQNEDYGSLPPLRFRSRPVVGADENRHLRTELEPEVFPRQGHKAHVLIMKSALVEEIFHRELAALFP